MAIQEHVDIVRQGPGAIEQWQERNRGSRLDLSGADLREISLAGADLQDADLTRASLAGVDLANADLTRATLAGTTLSSAELFGATLTGAMLRDATLSRADLFGATLSRAVLIGADLGEANLNRAMIIGANLTGAAFGAANLNGATLTGSDLSTADFRNATLHGATLTGATMYGTNLTKADLSLADLSRANLTRAVFDETVLASATCAQTIWGDCDLSQGIDLDTVVHEGPSTIGVDTLIRTLRSTGGAYSREQSLFFERAGIPDDLLQQIVGLVEEEPHQFYSVAICHATEDAEFAKRLCEDLEHHGVNVWAHSTNALTARGSGVNTEPVSSIYDKLIVVCSKDALQSKPIALEITRAMQRESGLTKVEATDTQVLLPVALDDYVLSGWEHPRQADIIAKHIGDFTEPAGYQQTLEQLLGMLRAGTREPQLTV